MTPAHDIAAFDGFFLADTATIEPVLPNGEPMCYPMGATEPVKVVVFGPSSAQFLKAKSALDREAMKRVMANVGKGKKAEPTMSDEEANATFLTAITRTVVNFPYPGGAEAMYRNPALRYINDQVMEHVNQLGNFFGGGKTS